jgi:hypothetical protein
VSFSADWLALRAGADAAARDRGLVAALQARFGGVEIDAVDLGAGSGATLGALCAALPLARWRLVDQDPALLAIAQSRALALGAQARVQPLDLARDLDAALSPPPALITASAFFDLACADWIGRFCDAAARAGAVVYAALTYDGAERWSPEHPEDAAVHAAFLRDMGRDKGLGPALGPHAGAALAAALRARRYTVRMADSPWRLTAPADAALIAALADGKADATGASAAWRAARRAAEAATIGHVDVLATPPDDA